MEKIEKYGLVKDYFKSKEKEKYTEKTHVLVKNGDDYIGGGITGWYTPKELIKYYGDCQCERVYYEKDYGEDDYGRPIIGIMNFLNVYALKDYDKEIEEERKK